MRRVWLIPLLIALLIILGLGALILRSDLRTFRPRLPKIIKLVEEQRLATPTIPAFLSRCLDHEASNDFHITRCLLMEFGMNHTTHRRWILRQWCWLVSIKWHLKKQERQWIYCRFVSDSSGQLGIQHLADKLCQKPITAMNDRELATLVVASRVPSVYLHDRAKLDAHTDRFLKEMTTLN